MSKDYSPFTPGVPVPAEAFVGRGREVEELVQRCKQAQSGRIERTFVEGDRGMGKSSLCAYVRDIADLKLDMMTAHVTLGGVSTIEELARRVINEFAKSSRERAWYKKLAGALGESLREVGIFGVSVAFEPKREVLAQLASNLESELAGLMELIKDHRSGMLLILDDINGLAEEPVFANWLKSFVDGIATKKRVLPLHLVLCGMPERRQSLLRLQPSLDRVFPLVTIHPMDASETDEFFVGRFRAVGYEVSPDALPLMTGYSGGYPVFLHEIGDAVFQLAKDRVIGVSVALDGVIEAARRIGERYLDQAVFREIRSDKYRSVLVKLTSEQGRVLSRKDVLPKLTEEEVKVFDAFVRRMKQLDVIESDEQRGTYHFKHLLERLYISMFAASRVAESRHARPSVPQDE